MSYEYFYHISTNSLFFQTDNYMVTIYRSVRLDLLLEKVSESPIIIQTANIEDNLTNALNFVYANVKSSAFQAIRMRNNVRYLSRDLG